MSEMEEDAIPISHEPEETVAPISLDLLQESSADAETSEPPTTSKDEAEKAAVERETPNTEQSSASEATDKEALAGEQPEEATSTKGPEAEEAKEGEEEEEGDGKQLETSTSQEDEGGESLIELIPSNVTLFGQLPTSVGFTEGELAEPSPLQVGVELGRKISRSLWEQLDQRRFSDGSIIFGGSSESEVSENAEELTKEQIEQRLAEEQRRRTDLMDQYLQLLSERSHLRQYNAKLQGKLAELLNKTKRKERVREELVEQHISDRDQRYSRYLTMLEELRSQQADEMAWYQEQIGALQQSCDQKLTKVEGEWKTYQAIKKEIAVYTMGRRLGGRQAAIREVDKIQDRELSKEKEMTEVRLENIKLKHRIQQLEANLNAQEELAEGLHLIDFEQLKIENQTYNEKIEERNEELLKLRRKITNTVQVLSQVKEKLQFVEAENQGQMAELMAVEDIVAQKREILTKTKQARDKLRRDNQRLQQKCGLLGNKLLLRDFEEKVDAAEMLNERLERLKRHHAGLSLSCNGIKKKIKGFAAGFG